jgi:hypothetical protein
MNHYKDYKDYKNYKDLKDYYKDLPLGKKILLRLGDVSGGIIASLPFVAVTVGVIVGLTAGISYLIKDYKRQINE